MFTGLIEHIGIISAVVPLDESPSGGSGFSLVISDAAPVLVDCHIGDSIAVNGVCLTVTEFSPESFKVGLSPETLRRSSLGSLAVGDGVNLERAMAADARFGGHFVQGHVDTTVSVVEAVPDGNSLRLTFSLPSGSDLLPYLVPKGYVALDGASLTITEVSDADKSFGVMLVAHTQSKITLSKRKIGEPVNLEVDMVGKYVHRSVVASLDAAETGSANAISRLLAQAVGRLQE